MDPSCIPFLRSTSLVVISELGIAVSGIVLTALGLLPTPTIPLLIIAWIFLRLRGQRWHSLGLVSPRNWKLTLISAILIGASYQLADVFLIVPVLESVIGTRIDLNQFDAIRGNFQLFVLSLVLAWTLAAFGEELLFRGYIFNRIEALFGNMPRAWIVGSLASALLFGVGHSAQGIIGVVDNVFLGLFISGLYLISGRNLWLPILMHGVIDTIGLSMLYTGIIP